jgi:hypothetical protein
MLNAVREQGVEGVVAKRKNSLYEAGHRTGAWAKYRVNRGQELVIGGYTPSPHGLDSIIVWLLPRQRSDLCSTSAKRPCASIAAADSGTAAESRDAKMPIRQSSRDAAITLGRGFNG